MPAPPKRIVVSRTDRIGDVVLSLPLLGLLRLRWPQTELWFLTRRYTRPIAEASEHVDRVIDWPDHDGATDDDRTAILVETGADVLLHLFPRREIAVAGRRAAIPRRIGTSRRWFHWLTCTERVSVSRKRSTLNEAQLNLRIAAPLLDRTDYALTELVPHIGLTRIPPLDPRWGALIDPHRFNLLLQPMTGGTVPAWPLERFAALASILPADRYRIFITGSSSEGAALRPWLATLPPHVVDVTGQPLDQLMSFAAAADGAVAASTGPLHIAAALGVRTLGLYPARETRVLGRWQPLGAQAEVVMPADDTAGDVDQALDGIAVPQVLAVLERWRTAAR